MKSGVEFVDILLDVGLGCGERAGRFHLQGNRCGSEEQSLRDRAAGHALCKVGAEGGVAASGAAGEVARLDRAGEEVLAVIDEHFAVVGDEDFLCAPRIQLLCSLAAVGQTGEDLGLCGVGLEEIEVFQIFELVRPVVEVHQAALVMTEEALDICGDLAALFQLDDQLVREITVQQTCQMIQAAVDLGDLIRRDGAGLGEAFRLAALAVGGEVGVLHERGGFARQDSDVVAVQLERINDIGVVRMDLNRSEKVCASRLGCCGAEENGAADFVDFFAGVVDVDVSCCGSDQHKIIFHSNHSFRITTETFALITV